MTHEPACNIYEIFTENADDLARDGIEPTPTPLPTMEGDAARRRLLRWSRATLLLPQLLLCWSTAAKFPSSHAKSCSASANAVPFA